MGLADRIGPCLFIKALFSLMSVYIVHMFTSKAIKFILTRQNTPFINGEWFKIRHSEECQGNFSSVIMCSLFLFNVS